MSAEDGKPAGMDFQKSVYTGMHVYIYIYECIYLDVRTYTIIIHNHIHMITISHKLFFLSIQIKDHSSYIMILTIWAVYEINP